MSLKGLLKNVKAAFLASKRGYIILLTKFKSRYFLFILLLSRFFSINLHLIMRERTCALYIIRYRDKAGECSACFVF